MPSVQLYGLSSIQVENKVVKKRILNDPVAYPEKFSEKAKSICEALLCKTVDQRLGFKNGSCDELRAHPFFSELNWMKLNEGAACITGATSKMAPYNLLALV